MERIAVCIAARNEPDIANLIEHIIGRCGWKVFVVDDASDFELDLPVHPNLTVLHNVERQGIAQSLMRAWKLALDKGAEIILQMDAGGSHDPGQLQQLVDTLHLGYGMAIGSRFMPGGEYIGNPQRKCASRIAAAACNWAAPKWQHTDWTSGFRGFRKYVAESLLRHDFYAAMHGWQIETLWIAHRNGAMIAETPITYTAGVSSFNWRVADEAFGVWLQMLLS